MYLAVAWLPVPLPDKQKSLLMPVFIQCFTYLFAFGGYFKVDILNLSIIQRNRNEEESKKGPVAVLAQIAPTLAPTGMAVAEATLALAGVGVAVAEATLAATPADTVTTTVAGILQYVTITTTVAGIPSTITTMALATVVTTITVVTITTIVTTTAVATTTTIVTTTAVVTTTTIVTTTEAVTIITVVTIKTIATITVSFHGFVTNMHNTHNVSKEYKLYVHGCTCNICTVTACIQCMHAC